MCQIRLESRGQGAHAFFMPQSRGCPPGMLGYVGQGAGTRGPPTATHTEVPRGPMRRCLWEQDWGPQALLPTPPHS